MVIIKTVDIRLPRELEQVEVHVFADWHIGDKHCDIDRIMEQIDLVKNTPQAYAILNGDLLDNATKTSVGDCYGATYTPMEQLQLLINLLTPIKDKILLVTNGNHEARTWKQDNVDLTEIVAQELGLASKYCREGGLLFLRVGRDIKHETQKAEKQPRQQCYTIYSTHGSGGGRKEGGKANRLADMASIIDADIYLHSHTHLPMTLRTTFYRTDYRNSRIQLVDKLFINTAAQLNYGGYGQTYEFKPSSLETPVLYLSGLKHKAWARL